MKKIIGRVSATEKNPTSCDEFIFWMDNKIPLKPFDIVKAENRFGSSKSITYAIVKNILHITDCPGHLSSYISHDFGDVALNPTTERVGVTFAECQVIGNTGDMYMPLSDGSFVYEADSQDIIDALGINNIPNPLPAGFIEGSNGVRVAININSEFILGPEGAHLNISGISGLATKTSYAMFLLNVIQQKFDDVAIIILNVKGDDLLRIDEENPLFDASEKIKWSELGISPKPFANVKYFYPYLRTKKLKHYANTALNEEAMNIQFQNNTMKNFVYTYTNDKQLIDLLFSNVEDPNFTIDSILNFIGENAEFRDLTWAEFKNKISNYTQPGYASNKDIQISSWRKFSRLIKKSLNEEGIFTDAKSKDKEKCQIFLSDEVTNINKGDVFVVDIACLDEQLQCFVFGSILKGVNDLKFGDVVRKSEGIPSKIIIFVDELNKYAASAAPKTSPILNYLLDITERGRSQGLILFSAEQFKSAVHDRVKGNCSTHIYGRTNAIEISKPDYRYLPKTYTNMMHRLGKGELIIQHPIFTTPLKITFPKPVYKQRMSDGTK